MEEQTRARTRWQLRTKPGGSDLRRSAFPVLRPGKPSFDAVYFSARPSLPPLRPSPWRSSTIAANANSLSEI